MVSHFALFNVVGHGDQRTMTLSQKVHIKSQSRVKMEKVQHEMSGNTLAKYLAGFSAHLMIVRSANSK